MTTRLINTKDIVDAVKELSIDAYMVVLLDEETDNEMRFLSRNMLTSEIENAVKSFFISFFILFESFFPVKGSCIYIYYQYKRE